MTPCSFCGTNPGKNGIKQVGRTHTAGTRFLRRSRCQDCGATMSFTGDLLDPTGMKEEWDTPPHFLFTWRRTRTGTLHLERIRISSHGGTRVLSSPTVRDGAGSAPVVGVRGNAHRRP